MTVESLLISVYALLLDPNPNRALNTGLAELYFKNVPRYEYEVRRNTMENAREG